jgi:hypothetical protein
MNQTATRVAVLMLTGSLCACASDSEPSTDSRDAGTDSAPARKQSASKSSSDPYEKSAKESAKDKAPEIDAEAVLAALPDSMKPDTLLSDLKSKLLAPDLDNGGVAMFTDVVTVQPGEDVTFCTYIAGVTDGVTYIHDTLGSQSKFGHHSILQYSTKPQEPGTRRCAQESQEAQQGQIIGGTGGEGTGAIKLPDDVVSEVPSGSQFIINHHWINVGDEEVEAQAEMITIPSHADASSLKIARAVSIVVPDFNIMPKQEGQHSGECTFEEDMNMVSMIGHEHHWGTHVKAERMNGESSDVIFDHDYNPDMVSHPLTTSYTVDEPFKFKTGDLVRMTCNWNNDSDMPLTFPREMCILFGWRLGGDRDTSCAKGKWR